MNEGYEYPLIDGISNDEVVILIDFFQRVEEAYENAAGVDRQAFLNAYRQFQRVVPTKMEQKQLEALFKQRSGYDAYEVIKVARQAESKTLRIS